MLPRGARARTYRLQKSFPIPAHRSQAKNDVSPMTILGGGVSFITADCGTSVCERICVLLGSHTVGQ